MREKECKITFRKISDKDYLCVVRIGDASYHEDDNLVSGGLVLLSKKYWKSGVIRKVGTLHKAAETRSLVKLVDDSVSLAR